MAGGLSGRSLVDALQASLDAAMDDDPVGSLGRVWQSILATGPRPLI